MRSTKLGLVLIAVMLITASFTHAQPNPITVRVDKFADPPTLPTFTSHPADSPILVDVGDVAVETVVHVYDSSGTPGVPQFSIGKLTVVGTHMSGGRLNVLIASPDELFPGRPDVQIESGVVDFGNAVTTGLQVDDANNPSGVALRDHTRVAISASGDIRGTIDVGQVFRIQADGTFDPFTNARLYGGTIDATILAHTYDGSPTANVVVGTTSGDVTTYYLAIEYIRAGRQIKGIIHAVGDVSVSGATIPPFAPGFAASIERIVVGRPFAEQTDPDVLGLQADVYAASTLPYSRIGTILTTGPIGAPGERNAARIYATNGVDEVRAITEDDRAEEVNQATFVGTGNTVYVPRSKSVDFWVDVRANYGHVYPHSAGIDSPPFAPIKLIQTEGSLTGNIECGDIWPLVHSRCLEGCTPAQCAAVPASCQHSSRVLSGILVRGVLDAPINVDGAVNRCDILARDLVRPITIGVMFRGCLVAHGRDELPPEVPSRGFMERVDIGHGTMLPGDYYYEQNWTRGFAGPSAPQVLPVAFTSPNLGRLTCSGAVQTDPNNYVNEFCDGYEPDWWLFHTSGVGIDSVIRADHIHEIDIVQMRAVASPTGFGDTKYPPRIEGHLIDSLRINDLREGAIWSGEYEWRPVSQSMYPGVEPVRPRNVLCQLNADYNAKNDYASIILADIGCIADGGNVWYDTCPRFVVRRSMLGGLYTWRLDPDQTISIGDSLGEVGMSFCGCLEDEWRLCLELQACGPNAAPCPSHAFNTGPSDCERLPSEGHGQERGHIDVGGWDAGDWIPLPPLVGSPVNPGLHGQVIINSRALGNFEPLFCGGATPPHECADPGQFRWMGKVTAWNESLRHVDDFSPDCASGADEHLIRLAPVPLVGVNMYPRPLCEDQPQPFVAGRSPYYAIPGDTIGGGAVGLVPFAIHYEDSVPSSKRESNAEEPGVAVVQSWTHGNSEVRIRYYGPVKVSSWGTGSPVRIMRYAWNGAASNVTNNFDIQYGIGPNGRDVVLRPKTDWQSTWYRGGLYMVTANPTAGTKQLLCANLDTSMDVPVKAEAFNFVFVFDCDGNGIDDFLDIGPGMAMFVDCNNDGVLDYCQMHGLATPALADLDQNGKPDVCEHPCLHPEWHADWNRSGDLSIADIFDFLNGWFAGCLEESPTCPSSADINHSGALEVQDIFDFLNAWFGGCL